MKPPQPSHHFKPIKPFNHKEDPRHQTTPCMNISIRNQEGSQQDLHHKNLSHSNKSHSNQRRSNQDLSVKEEAKTCHFLTREALQHSKKDQPPRSCRHTNPSHTAKEPPLGQISAASSLRAEGFTEPQSTNQRRHTTSKSNPKPPHHATLAPSRSSSTVSSRSQPATVQSRRAVHRRPAKPAVRRVEIEKRSRRRIRRRRCKAVEVCDGEM
ncbi:hypothetical protein Droror1_Dr00011928 [Drosera rotundifolia]